MPSVRFVLLHGLDADGLRFYTNRSSRKGRDAGHQPLGRCGLLVAGARPPGARDRPDPPALRRGFARLLADPAARRQLSAAASAQSQEIGSRAELEALVRALDERHPGDVPLPPTWGGYLIVPRTIELWESRADRLHDRVEYRRGADGSWHPRRLQP